MKILRLQPAIDTPDRYNYKVNYGVWDCIDTTQIALHQLSALPDSFINRFDVVLLPMYKRWEGNFNQLQRLKELPIKTILFDNDCCYRSFGDSFYKGIDYIFYRMVDRDGKTPDTPSERLLWSIDTNYYTPKYGGRGVSFNCTVDHHTYSLRQQIAKHIKPTNHTGDSYISHLRGCAAGIHTNSDIAPMPRCKMLEFAACGTQIISNRMEGINDYFPDDHITYFDSVAHLLEIVRGFEPDENIQKMLRILVEENHSDEVRAHQVINTIMSIC